MRNNPYTLIFGQEPKVMIPRSMQFRMIEDTFCSESPSQHVYMITGVRGSGKTVFMTSLAHSIREKQDWIVTELNSKRDMLTSLGAKLCSVNAFAEIFRDASINLSFFGFGLEVKNTVPITDIETALIRMLSALNERGKRVLITIDEADNGKEMLIFSHSFQIFLRENLPVFMLMTGLFENIDALQNERTLTFLYRAPKIYLEPLNFGTMADYYENIFSLPRSEALKMSHLTKGFSFAFQALGYFTWEHEGDYKAALTEYKQHLDEYVYEKIWSELSPTDRKVASAIASSETGKVAEIRSALGMSSGQFAPYRSRLIRKGIIRGDEYGVVRFTLPLFERFVEENYWE